MKYESFGYNGEIELNESVLIRAYKDQWFETTGHYVYKGDMFEGSISYLNEKENLIEIETELCGKKRYFLLNIKKNRYPNEVYFQTSSPFEIFAVVKNGKIYLGKKVKTMEWRYEIKNTG